MVTTRGAGPFRGLVPFGEGEDRLFFARDDERAHIRELLAGGAGIGGPILVTGELGSGKTSLLLAALLPEARRLGQIAFYIEISAGWEHKLRDDLARYFARPLEPTEETGQALNSLAVARGARVVLVLDQLEQANWLEAQSCERLQQMVANCSQDQVQQVFALDRDNLHVLGRIAQQTRIPDERRVTLGRLDRVATAKLIEQTVLSGGGYLEGGLAELIAEELCAEGPIVPAQMQHVCHAVMLRQVTTLRAYQRSGGASVLSTLYVEWLASKVGLWRARRVLAVLVSSDNPRDAADPSEIALAAGMAQPLTDTLLQSLAQLGLLRAFSVPNVGQKYALMHPYLRQSVRDLVAPLQRGRARAQLALKRRMDTRGVLRPHELLRIWRSLGQSVTDREKTLVQRSQRIWLVLALILAALPFAGYIGIVARLASTQYLSVARDRADTPRVVLRRGDPNLSFAFGWSPGSFGEVELDTGLALASMPKAMTTSIRDEALQGSLHEERGGIPSWLELLVNKLPAARQGALLVLAGQKDKGASILLAATEDPAQLRNAARLLTLLLGDAPQTRKALARCAQDARVEQRLLALELAAHLGGEAATSAMRRAATDKSAAIRLRALAMLAKLPPKTQVELAGQGLLDPDDRIQKTALKIVRGALKSSAVVVYRAILNARHSPSAARLRPITTDLEQIEQQIRQSSPRALATYLLLELGREKKPQRQVELLHALETVAHATKSQQVLPVIKALGQHPNVDLRAAAIGIEARFANPEQMLPRLKKLASIHRPRNTGIAMRRAAAVGLGLLGEGDDDRFKMLRRLSFDRAPQVRRAAVTSLLRLGPEGWGEVTKRMRRGFVEIGRFALHAVCSELTPERRMASAILGAAWSVQGGRLRRQALGCARSLATANPRLAVWLADQATTTSDSSMRQAAAEAVAMALAWRGARLERLARYYLRQRSADVRAAVLHAIVQRPPKEPAFLFRYAVTATRDSDPKVRAAAAKLAAISNPGRATPTLIPLLRDKEPLVWRAAVQALELLSAVNDKDRARLERPLADIVSRGRVTDALRALKVAERLHLDAPLKRAATHPRSRVRGAALVALVKRGKLTLARSALAAALRDEEQELRLAALRGIANQSGRLGEGAVTLLATALDNPNATERWAAYDALGHVSGKAVSPAIALLKAKATDHSETVRRMAMRALGILSTQHRAAGLALVAGTHDPALDVRIEARSALSAFWGRILDPKALWKLLLQSSLDGVQRRTAVAALGWHGRKEGPQGLEELINTLNASTPPAIRAAAHLALALSKSHERPTQILSEIYGW
ncbi:MAG: HEAT repeat domain-containing protein [Deltaproteobacteria bacterium]|nr:HEAT repeat domain-containing protein [Deltaproteobacteria bacterium]